MTSRELRDDNFTAFDLLNMAHLKKSAPSSYPQLICMSGECSYIRLGLARGNAWLGVNGYWVATKGFKKKEHLGLRMSNLDLG